MTAPSCSLSSSSRALGAVFLLHDRTTRDDDVVALLVELDDLELEDLAFEVARIAHRAHVDERTRQERADEFDLDGEAALDATVDEALDDLLLLERGFEALPGAGALGLLAGEARFAGAVLDAVQRDFDIVADGDFDFAAFVLELRDRDDGFGLESCAHHDDVGTDFDHASGEDLARANPLTREALFKHLGKTFDHAHALHFYLGALRPFALRASCPHRVDEKTPGFLPGANTNAPVPHLRAPARSRNRGEAAPCEREDLIHDLFDGEPRRVEDDRVLRRAQWRHWTAGIAQIPLADLLRKAGDG